MKRILIGLIALAAIALSSCGEAVELLGTGATFPHPLYKVMFAAYSKDKGVMVNYQGIGSSGGIQNLIDKSVDFAGSDAPMKAEELQKAGSEVLHIPSCLGAVVLIYNLDGNPKLRFTPELIADIFLGKITKWNDPRIKEVNPDVNLPDMELVSVHRSDGSGTTYTFTEYLSAVSPEWKSKIGTDKAPNWPSGLAGKGNPGVAGYVNQTKGSIGYVEVTYAKQNNMTYGAVQNKSGNFIEATIESIGLAADMDLPADTKVSLVNTASPNGYPIATFTWLLVYQNQSYGKRSADRAKATVDLIWWVIHEAQKYNETVDYGKLPPKAVLAAEKLLKSVVYDGKPILQ